MSPARFSAKLLALVLADAAIAAGALAIAPSGSAAWAFFAGVAAAYAIAAARPIATILRQPTHEAFRWSALACGFAYVACALVCVAMLDAGAVFFRIVCGGAGAAFAIAWHRALVRLGEGPIERRAMYFVAAVGAACATFGWTLMVAIAREPSTSQSGMGAAIGFMIGYGAVGAGAALAALVAWRGPRELARVLLLSCALAVAVTAYPLLFRESRPFGVHPHSTTGYE
jgi:hypothetical protein